MSRIPIHTDGSALGNPGPGGWGWASPTAEAFGTEPVAGDHPGGDPAFTAKRTTNNRMELLAILRALEANDGPVEIITDSNYAKSCLTEWVHGWRRRGWKTAAGAPVKNRDLIEPLAELLAGRDVTFTWVKGHAGDAGNERADRLARRGADEARAA